MSIESIKRLEAFLHSDVGSQISVLAALLAIVVATATLASLLPPLPAAVVAADVPAVEIETEPIRLPVVLADAPR